MDARVIIYNKFIKPFEEKNAGHIGVELEFPVVNLEEKNTDACFVASVLPFLEEKGFKCTLFGENGEKLFMENEAGDALSFDNSYNNFEFAMNHGDNLLDIYNRFTKYFDIVQEFLKKQNHTLVGCGTNPNYKNLQVNHVPFSTYNMVRNYLYNYGGKHNYPDFPAFISSVQTHLDVRKQQLPRAYTVFSKMDFVRGILFHNSPDFDGTGHRIYRDYLWQESAFGQCPNITGTVDESFETIDDILEFFLDKGLFNRIRNGKYETFPPTPIREYFKGDTKAEDIDCYLSFRNTEITSRGTLEIRSDCTQKEGRFFTPPAFNLGILYGLDKAEVCLDAFFEKNNITMKNSELRKIVATGEPLEKIAPQSELDRLLADMKKIALDALIKRGKGEEKLLVF